VTTAELGGALVHTQKSGVAHFSYSSDKECLNGIRQLIGYLPTSYEAEKTTYDESAITKATGFQSIVPDNKKTAYDVRRVIEEIADRGTFLEVQKDWAQNIVVGFIRVGHKTVGVVANQPKVLAGSLDYNAGDKAARFIRFCDCFGIAILTLVDVPAFLPGKQQEYLGIIRHGAKMLYAYSEATVPKISVILRKAYGGAYIAMNSKGMGADMVFAWPIAEIAVMGADGAANIIGRKRIESAEDKTAERAKIIGEYEEKFMNPYVAASRGYVDEVILPEETKERVVNALIMLDGKKKECAPKKHGNIPL
ncbi:MAG: methylmalonyl-CoA carboxyltransferase, partial [Clostridia bacterium]|nr:methylmalonyl-CoA carboxyltransferase [Clostridia bacterium]